MREDPLFPNSVMPGEWDVPPPESKEARNNELRMWAAVRMDIAIPKGKLAGQAGHAFLAAFARAPFQVAEAYMSSPAQAKIVLGLKDETELLKMHGICKEAGLPTALVRDQGRTVFGEKTYTAMGVGPCRFIDLPSQLKRLRLLPEDY